MVEDVDSALVDAVGGLEVVDDVADAEEWEEEEEEEEVTEPEPVPELVPEPVPEPEPEPELPPPVHYALKIVCSFSFFIPQSGNWAVPWSTTSFWNEGTVSSTTLPAEEIACTVNGA